MAAYLKEAQSVYESTVKPLYDAPRVPADELEMQLGRWFSETTEAPTEPPDTE